VTAPDAAVRPVSPARWWARRTLRYAVGGSACASAIVLLANQGWYRGAEAAMAGAAVSRWLGYPVIVARGQQTMFFAFHGTGIAHMLGLQVTLGCSSALLLMPVLLVTGLLLCVGQTPATRILLAALLAAGIVVCVNVLRLVLIALLVDWWGAATGFGWGHTLFGSVLTLAGMSAALAAFVLVLSRGGRVRAA
jgi:exosortase/archaeosortase family protein